MLGFSGSRRLSARHCVTARYCLAGAAAAGTWGSFVVGDCPSGLDAAISSSPIFQSNPHEVFRAASRHPHALVRRSQSMVFALQASSSPGLIAFPDSPCPSPVVPSHIVSRCFCGAGSGTWATAAMAAGLRVPLWVGGLRQSHLPTLWGKWVPSPRFPGCFLLVPRCTPYAQLPLFPVV